MTQYQTEQPSGVYKEAISTMTPAITKLLEHYKGFGNNEIEADELPENELMQFINQLDIYLTGASKRKLRLAIREFMTRLNCFNYRVLAIKDGISSEIVAVWNPLEQPYTTFLQNNANHRIITRINNQPYPPQDLISDWITRNIYTDIYEK